MNFFNGLGQQDASEFFQKLCEDSNSNYLHDLCAVEYITNTKCSNCDYTRTQTDHKRVVPLCIPAQNPAGKFPMTNLLAFNFGNWQTIHGSECEHCKGLLQTQYQIQNTNKFLVFSLQVVDPINNTKNTTFKLHDVPRNKIQFGTKKYAFSGGVFHHGANFGHGHYTAIVQKENKNLFKADDRAVNICKKWPSNSKDIYVLFYEESK